MRIGWVVMALVVKCSQWILNLGAGTANAPNLLRTVPTFVSVHTFCAS